MQDYGYKNILIKKNHITLKYYYYISRIFKKTVEIKKLPYFNYDK